MKRVISTLLIITIAVGLLTARGLYRKPRGGRCAFCSEAVLEAQTVYDTERWLVIVNYAPIIEGHLMLIPKRHVQTRHELTEEEFIDLYDLNARVRAVAVQHFGDTVEDVQFEKNGWYAGQSVEHFHIHFLPITRDQSSAGKLLWMFTKLFLVGRSHLSPEKLDEAVQMWRDEFAA